MRVAGFTPLCQQSLPLPLSISLNSLHPPSSNQHSYSPSPLAISMSSSVNPIVSISLFYTLNFLTAFSSDSASLGHWRTTSPIIVFLLWLTSALPPQIAGDSVLTLDELPHLSQTRLKYVSKGSRYYLKYLLESWPLTLHSYIEA